MPGTAGVGVIFYTLGLILYFCLATMLLELAKNASSFWRGMLWALLIGVFATLFIVMLGR